jgi:hypothetical protein
MPHAPNVPGRPVQHNPAFKMDRSIDNGGEFSTDGTVERPEVETDRGRTFTQPTAFPFND